MLNNFLLRRLNTITASILAVLVFIVSAIGVYASGTSNFQLTINPGTLAVDIVNGSYTTVSSPSVVFSTATVSFNCGSTTGTLGTASEQIYVTNPDAADAGWVVSIAGSATTATWASAGTDMDFNDTTSSGCSDGTDTDSVAGQLTVDPSGGTIAKGNCASCTTTSVTAGSSSTFNEGTTDSITLLTGASASADIGDWTLQGVALTQTIPAEQPAASDYNINMVLSIVAS